MCGSMADIQSLTAEIMRGNKKRRRRRKKQDENIYGLPYYIGRALKNERKKKKERKIETAGQKYNGLPYSIGWP